MRVCVGVRVCVRGVLGCVRDELSEYLLETRFLTSANYNTHPLRIFDYEIKNSNIMFVIELRTQYKSRNLSFVLHISTIQSQLKKYENFYFGSYWN